MKEIDCEDCRHDATFPNPCSGCENKSRFHNKNNPDIDNRNSHTDWCEECRTLSEYGYGRECFGCLAEILPNGRVAMPTYFKEKKELTNIRDFFGMI